MIEQSRFGRLDSFIRQTAAEEAPKHGCNGVEKRRGAKSLTHGRAETGLESLAWLGLCLNSNGVLN